MGEPQSSAEAPSVEELVVVPAGVVHAIRMLTNSSRLSEWMAPHVRLDRRFAGSVLEPGNRFRLESVGGVGFDYLVEAVSAREVVFAFEGPWSGRERWSFVPDGADTIVRRRYEVHAGTPLAMLAWRTGGRAVVTAHYKLELARFRSALQRDPGPRGAIEGPQPPERLAEASGTMPFPVDDA
ncbi:MAG TPA: hypothetical protein VEI06_09060 [Gemmatimonadaceae bacterium]|nr:hypothetical protein [Gemmatimonadaceae bacterium]